MQIGVGRVDGQRLREVDAVAVQIYVVLVRARQPRKAIRIDRVHDENGDVRRHEA